MNTVPDPFPALAACVLATASPAMELNPLFQDNAVLQCDARVPVWGSGRDGENITVVFAGQEVSTVVKNGSWKIWLGPMPPDATPRTLTVSGDGTREINNILVGEVWLAGGQSNMERRLGLAGGQKPIDDWEREAAMADHPYIRQFSVPQNKSFTPRTSADGAWLVCSPRTAENFSAVAYFFARDLFAARKIPVGIIHSTWGGTPAEAWTGEEGLKTLPDFAESLANIKRFATDPVAAEQDALAKRSEWYFKVDPGSRPEGDLSAADLDTSAWPSMVLPTYWEDAGHPDFDGIFWFRHSFELPETWDGDDAELHLGPVDDIDTTWINGVFVGSVGSWDIPRVYRIPAHLLKPGKNTIAVRVLDTGGGGGLYGGGHAMRLICNTRAKTEEIPLSGAWRYKKGVSLTECGWPPADFSGMPSTPTVLYNAMIAPLQPYAVRGVIWYQGEANVGSERQYRDLFPAMIADWRRAWGRGDFPFLFVQIAPYRDMTPEIREAQLLSWRRTKNTAMVVTTDCGDADDIHPTHKQPVGARLALAARALAYGEQIDFSGPVFDSMEVDGDTAVLRFTHLGGGLVAQDGELRDFVIAGPDNVFHPAQAGIVGDTIRVSAAGVSQPRAIRYGWAKVPVGNLFNRAGLPASPFRTDVD